MAESRGNERKCPRRLKKDITLFLNDLPDEILLRIISFLPTKSAVATSLLSKRWQYLWTSAPHLQLDESLFDDRDQFMNFTERALVLRAGSSLVSFSLKFLTNHDFSHDFSRIKNDASRIKSWITSAIRYNVEQFSLKLRGHREVGVLPFSVFGCRSLVKLVLDTPTIKVPSVVCLPCLKHLTLESVHFDDKESAEKLLSHPLLEELILRNCEWPDVTTVNVNSPMLQSLTIDQCDEEDDWSEERQVCFIGDNLRFFRYACALPPTQYCICGSTMQLREAEILGDMLHQEVQDMDGPSNRYCKLVNSLSMVQTLTLSDAAVHSLYILSQCSWLQTTLPVFEHVTLLNLHPGGFGISIDSVWLRMLYERCPQLEHLNFKAPIWLGFRQENDTPILMPIPSCFRTHLKKITLQSYGAGAEDEDPLFLLFNSAPVLEEVVIHEARYDPISDQVSSVEELERKLNARPKASDNCKVSIISVWVGLFAL